MKYLIQTIVAAISLMLAACGGDEPNNANGGSSNQSSSNNSSVTIKADGATSTGASFIPVDESTFFLDYVKYKIVDSHLEVVGHDPTELSNNVKIYANVTYLGITYKTRVIAEDAFKGCKNLETISLPTTLQQIGSSAFFGCTSLQAVTFPEELQVIGSGAFGSCVLFKTVIFPESLKSIESRAFEFCPLEEIKCKSLVPPKMEMWNCGYYCGPFIKEAYSTAVVYVPKESLDSYKEAYGWDYFKKIEAL